MKKNKPYPDCYLEAVERLGISKEEAIAVEDSLTGAKAATNAGLDVIVIPDCNLHHRYTDEELSSISCVAQGDDLRIIQQLL